MDEYSSYVREFRQHVLSKAECQNGKESARTYLKQVFHLIDQNHDGVITIDELRQFILALDIQLTPNSNHNISFAEILIHQIDLDNNGKISYAELMEFLWPKEISQREVGAVIQKIRLALMSSIKFKKTKNLSNIDDVTLIDAFGKLTGAPLLRGNLIEVRSLRKAFAKVQNPTLGVMSKYEVDILVTSLDTNCDGVVSAREFRKWLLREEEEIEFPSNPLEEEYNFIPTPTLPLEEEESRSVADQSGPNPEIEPETLPEIESETLPEIVSQELAVTAFVQKPSLASSSSSDPLISHPSFQASLNQRKNKTQYGTEPISSRFEMKAKESPSPPSPARDTTPSADDSPPSEQRSSTARWFALFGLGLLVVYAVYRGRLSLDVLKR
jgi:Ca2+-binding EF-hand superfamily protein